MKNAVMYSGHLEYFMTTVYILWAFGNFLVIWYIIYPLWRIVPRKIWQPRVKFHPGGEHSLMCRTKELTEGLHPWRITLPQWDKVHPWGSNFAPRGEVINWPLVRRHVIVTVLKVLTSRYLWLTFSDYHPM
jgi:hypothetical protein